MSASTRLAAVVISVAIVVGSTPAQAAADDLPVPEAASLGSGERALDVVHLQDGGLVRGTILELRPGESVTIKSAADGSSRTFAWAEVASTQLGAAPARERIEAAPVEASPAWEVRADAAAPVPPSADEPGGRGLPRVRIETRGRRAVHLFTAGEPMVAASSPSATTMRTARSGLVLRSVCQAPCDAVIDGRAGYPFYFGGDRMPLSRPLYLNYAEGEITAEVSPGRVGLLMGGLFAVAYGGVGAIAGGTLLGVAPERFAKPGGIVLGAGVALLISGVVMVVHGRTRHRLRSD